MNNKQKYLMRKKRLTDQFHVIFRHFLGGAEEEYEKITIRITCVSTEIRIWYLPNRS